MKLTITGLLLFKRNQQVRFGTPFGGCVSWYSGAKSILSRTLGVSFITGGKLNFLPTEI